MPDLPRIDHPSTVIDADGHILEPPASIEPNGAIARYVRSGLGRSSAMVLAPIAPSVPGKPRADITEGLPPISRYSRPFSSFLM